MTPLFKAIAAAATAIPLALAVAGSTPTRSPLAQAAASTPAHTVEQALALRRAHLAEAHPQWRNLSVTARIERLGMFARRMVTALAAGDPVAPGLAQFQGNLTLVKGPSGQAIALQRQADCSLSLLTGSYTLSLTAPAIEVLSTTANEQAALRAAAGLSGAAGSYPRGCAEPTAGIGTRRGFYLGRTSQNLWFFASTGYNYVADSDAVYYGTIDAATRTVRSLSTDLTVHDTPGMTAGDLNGDGLADIAVLNLNVGNVTVWLARADGTLSPPVAYPTSGSRSRAAVMADLDGDGKLDLVVAGSTYNATTFRDEQSIAVLRGRGDGTFAAATSFPVATPSTSYTGLLTTMVAADLRGTGKPDIVGSNGLVLLNDGSGNLAPAPAFGFPSPGSNNSYGPHLAAGDFNEDGKPDVVTGTGNAMQIYLGRGDGTFTVGRGYANADNVGYMSVTDLDGDGHLDLWVGLGNGGFLGGDQYGVNQGYALLGRGDGSFAGAPVMPFVHTGDNLVDLDHDGKLDAVGVNADRSFTSYKGDGSGGFTAIATLQVGSLVIGGQTYSPGEIDSFGLADIDGDSHLDLVFLARDFVARYTDSDFYTPGMLIARGDGRGGFATPTFLAGPAFAPAGDFDYNPKLRSLRLADVNGDGKADLVYSYASTAYFLNQRTLGTAVQLGNGNGTFQAPHTFVFLSGIDNSSFPFLTSDVQQIADLNRDGKPDLIMVTQTTTRDSQLSGPLSNVQVALGHGDGTFEAPATVAGVELLVHYSGTGQRAPIVLADQNGDGLPDLTILGSSAGYNLQVAIALGNGDGTFKAPARTTFAAQALGNGQELAVADFNGDGKADLLLANPYGTSGIVYGNGDGTLAPLGSVDAYRPNLSLAIPVGGPTRVVDFNGDARPDVIVGNVQLLSTAAAVPAAASFSLDLASASGTVRAGQSVQTQVTVTPGSGFSGTVEFACGALPAGATCSFAPTSVSTAGGAASTTLTLGTSSGVALAGAVGSGSGLPGALLLGVLGLIAWARSRSGTGSLRRLGLVALLATGGVALNACGGHDHVGGPAAVATPSGSYSVTVTATAGSDVRSVVYTLVVD